MGFLFQLRRHAEERAGDDAIVFEGGSLSHAALLDRVERGMVGLRGAGIDATATVGLTIADEVEHLIATLSLLCVGARQVTLASHDPVTVRETLARRVGVTHELVHAVGAASSASVEVLWPATPPQAPPRDALPDQPEGTVYLKTSGTTGDMNIVPASAANLVMQAAAHAEYASERLLRVAAIEHNNSKRHRLYCVVAGGTNVFRPVGDFDLASVCIQHRVSCLDISRMHASGLAAAARRPGLDQVKIRTGGSSVPFDVRREIELKVTARLYVRYAATECGGIAMAGPGDHDGEEAAGRPLPGVEVQIVDADGAPLPLGASGHIRVRAPGMAEGYFDNPAATARRFRDGWFWPGDMGRFRTDGQLVVQGRGDDMMILNGLNIFPAEIERVLERHPAVAFAAALPLESAVHGQIPVAAVELRTGAALTPADLLAYGREHLALRAPRRIVFVETMPRNSQGKLLRRELAPLFDPRRTTK